MKRTYENPAMTVMNYEMIECLMVGSTGTDFEVPDTGEVPVNPGEGHDPGEAFSKTSVWDE
ncbi:MAG: hypothetical protein IKH63_12120 [Prevotella sp.]|nr:hypothetical protein [Prevotella sp.]